MSSKLLRILYWRALVTVVGLPKALSLPLSPSFFVRLLVFVSGTGVFSPYLLVTPVDNTNNIPIKYQ